MGKDILFSRMESLTMEQWETEENKRIESQLKQFRDNEARTRSLREKKIASFQLLKSDFCEFLVPNHGNIEVFVQSIAMAFAAVFLVVVFRYYPISEYFQM